VAHDTVSRSPFVLPVQIVGPVDINRLLRELEAVEDFMGQAAIREPGTSLKLPRTSRLLDEFSNGNKLNFLMPEDRAETKTFLSNLQEQAPVLHFSFASDPSAVFVSKIVTWLRANIHPQLLLRVGLEPTIAAGCVVRTSSHQFDFSLRQHFAAERPTLIKLLDGVSSRGADA
jgi:hypothetical protein